jgi:hypothetical protein
MAKFVTRQPKIIEAEQFFDNKPCQGVYGGFINQRKTIACLPEQSYEVIGPAVITIHGQVTPVIDGDWVVKEPDGIHYYPIKPDIFEQTYKPLES